MTIFRKMNRTGLILSLFAATICSAVIVSAAIKEPKDAKCPVSGEACDPEANATFAGGKIWFCCDKCAAAFKPTRLSLLLRVTSRWFLPANSSKRVARLAANQ